MTQDLVAGATYDMRKVLAELTASNYRRADAAFSTRQLPRTGRRVRAVARPP